MSYTNLVKKITPYSSKCEISIDKQWVFINKKYLTNDMKLLNNNNCICGRKITNITLVYNPRTNTVCSVGGSCLNYFKLLHIQDTKKLKIICPLCKKTNSNGYHKSCLKKSNCGKKLLEIYQLIRTKLSNIKKIEEKKKNIEIKELKLIKTVKDLILKKEINIYPKKVISNLKIKSFKKNYLIVNKSYI